MQLSKLKRGPKVYGEYEKVDNTTIVEMRRVRPLKDIIEEMLAAGERLDRIRMGIYDYDTPEEAENGTIVDPTRGPNFDLTDLSALRDRVLQRVQAQERAKVEEAAREKAAYEEFKKNYAARKDVNGSVTEGTDDAKAPEVPGNVNSPGGSSKPG